VPAAPRGGPVPRTAIRTLYSKLASQSTRLPPMSEGMHTILRVVVGLVRPVHYRYAWNCMHSIIIHMNYSPREDTACEK